MKTSASSSNRLILQTYTVTHILEACLYVALQLKVTDYHVRCSVVSRYAVTTVESSVWNQLPVTKEAAFEVDLPSSAFISNFTM